MPCIIINEKELQNAVFDSIAMLALLAHEVGHINNGNFNTDATITRKFELDADYYSGFWSGKNQRTNFENILPGFKLFMEDKQHPPFEPDRKRSLHEGWTDGVKPFEIKPSFVGQTMDSLYGRYLNAAILVTPGFKRKNLFGGYTVKHNVFLSIQSNDYRLSNRDLFKYIDYVTYVYHPPTFTKSGLTHTEDDSTDGFQTKVTVWGEFPITIITTFKDGTVWPLAREFYFPDAQIKK